MSHLNGKHAAGVQALGAAIIELAVHDYRELKKLTPADNRQGASTKPSFLEAREARDFLFKNDTLQRVTDLFKLDIDPARIRAALLSQQTQKEVISLPEPDPTVTPSVLERAPKGPTPEGREHSSQL